jgi:arabinofuranosyltransferase
VRWYGAAWDGLEGWLIAHWVGMRHQEHKAFGEFQLKRFPGRDVGSRIPSRGHPVLAEQAVGVAGWVLPHVAILDWFGLNDAVIAHAKPIVTRSEDRHMAHDRWPPEGYIECFRPNVVVHPHARLGVRLRARVLTAEEIRRCEERFLAGAGR